MFLYIVRGYKNKFKMVIFGENVIVEIFVFFFVI